MKIYCSGIGGIGLSAYASLQKLAGHDVMGSDRSDSALLDDLRSQGIGIVLDQSGTHIPNDCDLLVYSEAIPETSPERQTALKKNIAQKSYPQALGELSAGYHVIAVCGTHGKSSTTAMAARLLIEAGHDPTVVVGTKMRELSGRNWRKGKSDIFLLEACEYCRSFHHYSPQEILLTNADGDHFDYYRSQQEYHDAFVEFVKKLPENGVLITHLSEAECAAIAGESKKSVIDADTFPLLSLKTPGRHMQENAKLVLALASHLHITQTEAKKIVSEYAGSWRRMERKGSFQDVPIIDDYAHHPREIRATLQAMREAYPQKRIVCVFQPHTHDRTLKLAPEFARSFADADLVLVTDIYDARAWKETARADPKELSKSMRERSEVDARYIGSLSDTEKELRSILQKGDVLVCLGAGDITKLADVMSAEK